MKNDLLEIDVQLLIKRYGLGPVLNALAELEHQTLDQIEQRIQSLKRSSSNSRTSRRHRQSLQEIVNLVASGNDEILEPLRLLAERYESRSFLHNLRDVQLFFSRLGEPHRSFKSRELAGPILMRALAKLPLEDLLRLSKEEQESGESDYSLLSRAIMGRP